MAEVIFFIAALGVIAGAIGTVSLRNAFYAVLALVGHLLSLAALFLLLRAEFVAAAQVVVYAGAVMVLYVFVVAYVGGADRALSGTGTTLRGLSVLFVGRAAHRVLDRDPRDEPLARSSTRAPASSPASALRRRSASCLLTNSCSRSRRRRSSCWSPPSAR
jgi:hypothetical protein